MRGKLEDWTKPLLGLEDLTGSFGEGPILLGNRCGKDSKGTPYY